MKFAAAMAVLLFSATGYAGEPLTIESFDWIVGTWKRETEKSITYESWNKLSDGTYEGTGRRISKENGQTVFGEALLLVEMGNEIFYIARVAENEYPIAFKLTSMSNGTAVFTNPKHDYPQRITYRRNPEGTLLSVTTGDIGDTAERRIDFLFVKER